MTRFLGALALALATLAGCGGGGNGKVYTVGGTVTGLQGTLVVESGGETLSLTANGPYTLQQPIPDGTTYALTVKTQPAGQTCTVSQGSGTVHGNVSDIQISCSSSQTQYVRVRTLAGSTSGYAEGDGATARFSNAEGIAVGSSCGLVFVADMMNHRIRQYDIATGMVSTLAGSGTAGSSDGTGAAASFNYPQAVAADGNCNVYVADTSNNMIRKITRQGVVSTVAGATTKGRLDGAGTAASFWYPTAVALDGKGNLFVADGNNNLIRKIVLSSAEVSTVAGTGAAGNANGAALTAASFNSPRGLAVDAAGIVYVADSSNNLIRKIDTAGQVSTLAGSGAVGSADGTGTQATFSFPHGMALDAAGNLILADGTQVRKLTSDGVVSRIAGLADSNTAVDGTLDVASFNHPQGVAVDTTSGFIYVMEVSRIRRISD